MIAPSKTYVEILVLLVLFYSVISCKKQNHNPTVKKINKNPMAVSLKKINSKGFFEVSQTDYENSILEKFNNKLGALEKATLEEKIIYLFNKSKDISNPLPFEIRKQLLQECKVNKKNVDNYLCLILDDKVSEYTISMAIQRLKIYFLEHKWKDIEFDYTSFKKYISLIKKLLADKKKQSIRIKGELYSLIIDSLTYPQRNGINKKYLEIIKENEIKELLKTCFKNENNNGIQLFVSYYLFGIGDKDVLEWIIRNINVLQWVTLKNGSSNSSNPYNQQKWYLPPPFYFIRFNRTFEANTIKYSEKIYDIPFLLKLHTNKSFKTADQWQDWYNKNKDNIVWDAEKKKYIVK